MVCNRYGPVIREKILGTKQRDARQLRWKKRWCKMTQRHLACNPKASRPEIRKRSTGSR